MQPTYLHNVIASFTYFAENELLVQATAYRNYTSQLYYYNDTQLDPAYVAYAAPFKQWVYDQGVSGAVVLNEISGDLNLSNNESGMFVDYGNGRVLLPASFGTNLTISGTYAFKDFNFYLSNETEQWLINNGKFWLNPRFGSVPTSGIVPYQFVTPCIFTTNLNEYNEPWSINGQNNTHIFVSQVVFAETVYQLNGVMSVFSDCRYRSFPFLSINDDPINEYGDIKTGVYPSGYNYDTLVAQKGTPGNIITIENVRSARLSDRVAANPNVFLGIIQFELTQPRYLNN